MQAQLLRRRHDGDLDRPDAELSDVLATVAPESRELRGADLERISMPDVGAFLRSMDASPTAR
ncbi:hypothetical protein [Kitasatospora purpeofusca]|uniref:hypothetical protein n=1 Tax=Kitasatospora purpeofusca TaxID=67352 RepID=UPI00365C03B0